MDYRRMEREALQKGNDQHHHAPLDHDAFDDDDDDDDDFSCMAAAAAAVALLDRLRFAKLMDQIRFRTMAK